MNFESIKDLVRQNHDSRDIPQHKVFKEATFFQKLIYMDFFTLTTTQRLFCTIISGVLGVISFLYSITKFVMVLFKPSSFLVPYIFSNLMFFSMIGFIKGFSSYFRNLFQYQRKRYTIAFFSSTVSNILIVLLFKSYILSVISVVLQILSFGCFCFTFFPFGSQTLNGFLYSTFGI